MAMARLFLIFILVALSLVAPLAAYRPFHFHVHARPLRAAHFTVQGRVFCDTCRAGFETSASTYIHGARVRVECKHRDTLSMIYSVEGLTDKTGTFKITVTGDHNDQLCEAVLVSSPLPECATIEQGRERARVYPTYNNGIASTVRFANNMGFLKDAPLAGCAELLKQYQESDD